MDLATLRTAIPDLVARLGLDPDEAVLEPDAWVLQYGSVAGYIALLQEEGPEGDPFVYVRFMVLRVPPHDPGPLLRRLLEYNHSLGAVAAFSVDPRDRVWLAAGRHASHLEHEGLEALVAETAALADRYDDELIREFGRQNAVR